MERKLFIFPHTGKRVSPGFLFSTRLLKSIFFFRFLWGSLIIRCPKKVFEHQKPDHSPPSRRSLPTSSSCYYDQSSLLPFPAAALPAALGGQKRSTTKVWKDGGEQNCWRGGEGEHMSAQRRSERQRQQPAHVRGADGESVWEWRREGWWGVRWERRYFSERGRGRETERGGGRERDLLFMCLR